MGVNNHVEELKFPEQTSRSPMSDAKDVSFACMKINRENRISKFEPFMDSEHFEQFTSALSLFDEEQDVTGRLFEECLKRYMDALIALLEVAVVKQRGREDDRLLYIQAVEELYLINCEKIKRDNVYCVYTNHPMLLINKRLDLDTMKELEKKQAKSDEMTMRGTEYEILRSVFDAKMKNRRRMRFYCSNQVYETDNESVTDETKFVNAKPFEQSNACTSIPKIRIWEKIKNYMDFHRERKLDEINIAVFGNLTEDTQNDKFYDELLEKLLDVKINWTSFQHEFTTGEYIFADKETEEIYDLLDMTDLQMLVDRYEIVLFLDQNCFYRQGQAEKNVEEQSADTTCRWFFERSLKREEFKDKAAFYRNIYNRVGQWINSVDSNQSASFEFDERLYRNLSKIPKEKTDIYLYIRYGTNIGGYKLANNGICNDEYYDGITLTVCRLSKLDKEQFNEDYAMFLKRNEIQDSDVQNELYVPIRFWKLLKSTSNDYCDVILKKFAQDDVERWKDILCFLNESSLVLYYDIDSKDDRVCIHYDLQLPEKPENLSEQGFSELQKIMSHTAIVILQYAFGKEKLYCINRYFERLLIYSVISHADDVGDLIFAYWIASHWYTVKEVEEEKEKSLLLNNRNAGIRENDFSKRKNRFKVRKTIYSMVKRLADMRMRNVPDMEDFFSASFHGEVCPEVSDENLDRTYRRIVESCEKLKYTSGYLYSNSRILLGR